MKREIITISENGNIHIPTTPVWVPACEIADLLGAFASKVSEIFSPYSEKTSFVENENIKRLFHKSGFVELYDMNTITILFLHIHT